MFLHKPRHRALPRHYLARRRTSALGLALILATGSGAAFAGQGAFAAVDHGTHKKHPHTTATHDTKHHPVTKSRPKHKASGKTSPAATSFDHGVYAVPALRAGDVPTVKGLSRARVKHLAAGATTPVLYAQYVGQGEGRPVSDQVIEAEASGLRYSPAQTLAAITATSKGSVLLGLANHLMVNRASGTFTSHATFSDGAGYQLGDNTHGDFFGIINGSPSGYCANKGAAKPAGNYTLAGRGADANDADYRADYILFTYGNTTDNTTAAAVSIIEHGLLGDDGYGTGDLDNGAWVGKIGAAVTATTNAVSAKVTSLWDLGEMYRGPYTEYTQINTAAPYTPGEKLSVSNYVLGNSNSPLPGVNIAINVSTNLTRSAQSVTTDGNGNGDTTVTINGNATGPFTVSGTPTSQLAARYAIYDSDASSCTANGQTTCTQRLSTGIGFSLAGSGDGGTVTPAAPTNYFIQAFLNKSTDDPAYVGADGAVFSLHQDSQTANEVARGTVTGGTIAFPRIPTPDTNDHIYCVHEESAPAGINLAADQCHVFSIAAPNYTFDYTTPANFDTTVRGSITAHKTDSTGASLPGATFSLAYDSDNNGSYETVIGTGTTDGNGNTTFGNLLVGRYEVTETGAPAGHVISAAPQDVVVVQNQQAAVTVTFNDASLVPAQFQKLGASGTFDPKHQPDFAGAVISVTGPSGSTSCTLDASGACTTPAVLVEGETYTWTETTPPSNKQWSNLDPTTGQPVTGTFTAPGCTTGTGACGTQVKLSDQGLEQPVSLVKTEAGKPSQPVAGATFDLCVPAGQSLPSGVTYGPAPATTGCTTGQTYVATATTDSTGTALFGSLLPVAIDYCAAETVPAPGYLPVAGQICGHQPQTATTGLVLDTAEVPAPAITVKKTELLEGTDTGLPVPGAVYDLCLAAGSTIPPGSTYVAPTAPASTACAPGEVFAGQTTTSGTGEAEFLAVPGSGTGVSYCVHELSVPATTASQPLTYQLDTTAHCTKVTDTSTTLAVTDALATTAVSVVKTQVGTGVGVPGAVYGACTSLTAPGATYPTPGPGQSQCQTGETFLGTTTTGPTGEADITATVPAGAGVCVYEISVPASGLPYTLDTQRHCAMVTGDTSTIAVTDSVVTGLIGFHKTDATTGGDLVGARYAACSNQTVPGITYPPVPAGTLCPAGMTYVGVATTDAHGGATVTLPVVMGSSVCVTEVTAPAGYAKDTTTHCNVLSTATDTLRVSDAKLRTVTGPKPHVPTVHLAFTGVDHLRGLIGAGVLALFTGSVLFGAGAAGRRRRSTRG